MPPLTFLEELVLEMIHEAIKDGRPCPSNFDIEMATRIDSTSIGPTLIKRLEQKGYITATRYQRAREVTITATGQSTAPHPQRRTTRKHVPRGSGSAVGKLAKASRGMA